MLVEGQLLSEHEVYVVEEVANPGKIFALEALVFLDNLATATYPLSLSNKSNRSPVSFKHLTKYLIWSTSIHALDLPWLSLPCAVATQQLVGQNIPRCVCFFCVHVCVFL